MKIAVTALGESPDSPIDQRFGRARFFMLFDTDIGQWSAHGNKRNLESAQGAGAQAAQLVVDLGAKIVITGHCGPNAFATLCAAKIDVYQEASGTVQDAFDACKAGSLKKSGQADVELEVGSV